MDKYEYVGVYGGLWEFMDKYENTIVCGYLCEFVYVCAWCKGGYRVYESIWGFFGVYG